MKDELSFLEPKDRKFQFYKIDLNNDGNEEIFVRLMSSYFCGSGGCTFLLLDKYAEVITKFTVTRAPIFVESTKVNGWSVLLVRDAGVLKELTFENGSYPSNPSVLPKAPYDAPSGHAQLMFDDDVERETCVCRPQPGQLVFALIFKYYFETIFFLIITSSLYKVILSS